MGDGRFDVDPDIRRARTLPAEVYADPRLYAAQIETAFARGWHLVRGAERVATPGDVLPFMLLEGSLDEPLLLTRDAEGRLRCLSNVCTHRGNLVVECESNLRGLRCRYHGRRFALDGSFRSMPEFEQTCDFPTEADDLPELALERWGPLCFVSLDPVISFDDWLGPVRARLGGLSLDDHVLDPQSSRDYLVEAHWALYCENYLEGFHIPFVHPGLSATLEPASYATEIHGSGSLQIAVTGRDQPAFELPAAHPDHGRRVAAYYGWLFPNLMLNFYPWGLSVNIVEPLGLDRTRVRFFSYVADRGRLGQGAGGDLHQVELEDETVVQAVQKGVRSRLYRRGRFSATHEQGVHHFQRLLSRHVACED